MVTVKCNSCGGTYGTAQRDGLPYTHVCPDKVIDQHAQCNPLTGEVTARATYKPLANPRNENVSPETLLNAAHSIVSEGAGVTELK